MNSTAWPGHTCLSISGSRVRVLVRPPSTYETGHSGRASAAGGQYACCQHGARAADPDLPVIDIDPLDELPHVALAQRTRRLILLGVISAPIEGDSGMWSIWVAGSLELVRPARAEIGLREEAGIARLDQVGPDVVIALDAGAAPAGRARRLDRPR